MISRVVPPSEYLFCEGDFGKVVTVSFSLMRKMLCACGNFMISKSRTGDVIRLYCYFVQCA